jgi:DNA-binding LacI/PurR family transcriptional regulator
MRRNVRLKDVAARAGVALSTASMALSGHPAISPDTRTRVLSTSRELGYVGLDERLLQQRGAPSRQVCLALFGARPDDEGYAALVFALAEAARGLNQRLELATWSEPGPPPSEAVLERAAHAGVLLLCGVVPPEISAAVVNAGVPALALGHLPGDGTPDSPAAGLPKVLFDDQGMGRQATGHLLAQGHRRIAFACATLVPGLMHDCFRDGYRLALLAAGVPWDPALEVVAGRSRDPMHAAAAHFTSLAAPPTAYVVPNATDADHLCRSLARLGAAPPQAALVLADSPGRSQAHGLAACTTLRGDLGQFARAALERAQALRADPRAVAGTVLIPFTMGTASAAVPPVHFQLEETLP